MADHPLLIERPRPIVIGRKLMRMNLATHFQMLARCNRIANERLFAKCAQLNDAEYRKGRAGTFGSIHGLVNHILLGDRRWMGLFESGERVIAPLSQILYDDFSDLQSARTREDVRIEAFFAGINAAFWSQSFAYTNHKGQDYEQTAHVACSHLVNHQRHQSRAGPCDAESDRGGASITRLAPHHESLESAAPNFLRSIVLPFHSLPIDQVLMIPRWKSAFRQHEPRIEPAD